MFCNSNIDTSGNIPLWWYTNIALTLIYLYWFVVCVSPAQVQDLMYLKSPFPNIHAHTSILNYYYISSRHIYSERSLLIETRMWKTNIYCTTLQIHERINGHSTKYIISCNVKVFPEKICLHELRRYWLTWRGPHWKGRHLVAVIRLLSKIYSICIVHIVMFLILKK